MGDRRRMMGLWALSRPPVFLSQQEDIAVFGTKESAQPAEKPQVQPEATASKDEIRRIFLKTGLNPSASGSAYYEVAGTNPNGPTGVKLACSVHGPRSLTKSGTFSPFMILNTTVRFAGFATQDKGGSGGGVGGGGGGGGSAQQRETPEYALEQDLTMQLQTALRGAIICDRWPKSCLDIGVTILESDLPPSASPNATFAAVSDPARQALNSMNILAGCITVAAAALADAGIDCVDTVSGGVASLVLNQDAEGTVQRAMEVDGEEEKNEDEDGEENRPKYKLVLSPLPLTDLSLAASCCVAYLANRDELVNLWMVGRVSSDDISSVKQLIDKAILAARGSRKVLLECLSEMAQSRADTQPLPEKNEEGGTKDAPVIIK